MFKDKNTDEYMYPILDYEPYCVSRSGKVGLCQRIPGNGDKYQDFKMCMPFDAHGRLCVKIKKANSDEWKVASIAKLNLDSIFGELPFGVRYLDLNKYNVSQKNIYPKFTNIKIQTGIEINEVYDPSKYLILSDDKGRYELFKEIPYEYFNGIYWISNKGAIFNLSKKHLISRSNDDHGYYKVSLNRIDRKTNKTTQITFKVHTLVYSAWKNPIRPKMTIDHKDGRQHNNNISNLEEVTMEENLYRMRQRNILIPTIIRSKWTDTEVIKVCKLLEENKTYAEIAEALGISTDKNTKEYVAVCNLCKAIIDRRVFTYISKNYNIQSTSLKNKHLSDYKTPQKFDIKIIEKVCMELVSGKGPAEVSRLYPEIPLGTIQNIKTGRQYRNVSDTIPGMKELIENRKKVSVKTISKRSWSNEECELICQMLHDGKSNLEIAEALGYKYDEKFSGSSEMIAVANIIQGLYTKRLHKKICDKYTFPTDRKALYFPNAGQFTSSI